MIKCVGSIISELVSELEAQADIHTDIQTDIGQVSSTPDTATYHIYNYITMEVYMQNRAVEGMFKMYKQNRAVEDMFKMYMQNRAVEGMFKMCHVEQSCRRHV